MLLNLFDLVDGVRNTTNGGNANSLAKELSIKVHLLTLSLLTWFSRLCINVKDIFGTLCYTAPLFIAANSFT